jgi:phospholipid/cholesterol/gamma-HCH transport system ATP-binding protein
MPALEINQLRQAPGDTPDKFSQAAPVLQFDKVSVSFQDQAALAGISLSVRIGETVVIFGASGSGKTVLLKTGLGLICPDAGSVRLFGQEITHLRETELLPLRLRAGMLFQEGALFDSLTVGENVAYPLLNQPQHNLSENDVSARVKEELDFVELGQAIDQYPDELSGGMRRRVGIARAAVTRPPLVLYDSPTAGLDPITAYRIIALVIRHREKGNTTTLVVTHRYQDAHLLANASYDERSGRLVRAGHNLARTRFVVLKEGRLVFEGSEPEMRSSTDPYVSKFVKRVVQTRVRT